MAPDPLPGDRVAGKFVIQGLPEFLVRNRLAGRGFPVFALPLGHPGLDALLHILGISHDQNPAGAIQAAQGLDNRCQFHSIVGGVDLSTEYLFLLIAVFQQRPPATWTRIALASAIGVDHDLSGIAQWLAPPLY